MATNKQLNDEVTTDWVTPGVAASALGVSLNTLVRLADAGEIRAIRPTGKHRRYAAADVEAILAREPWDAS